VDEFINELDLAVNKVLDDGKDQKIAKQKSEPERQQCCFPVFQQQNANADKK
jgi:hypothetical protein